VVGKDAAGVFTLSWCPRAGWGTVAKTFLLSCLAASNPANAA
jgi:hypothetical protein